MSTVFDFRSLRLPKLSRASIIVGSLAIVAALVLGFLGIQLYKKLTNNTVVAYFPVANALYNGDRVEIMGVKVGAIDKIEPAGDKMKVTFHYSNKYKVPADAQAVILNPTLVASRLLQLEPPYKGGPVLADNAVIPEERTQVPTEWDELRNTITNVISKLGPTKEQPKGPFGDVIEAYADGLAGKGKQINTTFNDLSRALTALNQGRGDFFAVVRSLALFVNALHADDQKFVALNKNLAQFTNSLTGSDHDLANAVQQFDGLLTTVRPFLDKNAEVLTHDINNLADTTNALVQPEPLNGLETGLHVLPTALANANLIYHPAHSALVGQPAGHGRHAWASRTRWNSSAAPFRPAAGWATRSPPSSARSTWRRFSTRSSSTTCRSVSTRSASPRHCPRKSPTPRTGCIRRTATRTPPCRVSGCPTHRRRTATPSTAGSPRPACRASRWGRSLRAC